MSQLFDAFRSFAAWWHEGLTKIGMQLLEAHGGVASQAPADANHAEIDREAWEQERARLALSPWWI